MSDQGEEYQRSWILYHYLDWWIGSEEIVDIRRKGLDIQEQVLNADKEAPCDRYLTGSRSEGFGIKGSDIDCMLIDKYVVVLCPDQMSSVRPNRVDKSIMWMRPANSRPGYVTLEVVYLKRQLDPIISRAKVPVGDHYFLSSEVFHQDFIDMVGHTLQINAEKHGPAAAVQSRDTDIDSVSSFKCLNWPKEANEWVIRPRLHGWPNKTLRDAIVPVGDKTSSDTFLQWRISFATAEKRLVYSLSHVQFLVYGLLKYFLKQISDMLKQLLGDTDILSSYIMKTVVFHAVEKTSCSLWQNKHTFICFMLCLNILITWVKAGHCPNYFIPSNNMFLGKVHGEIQQKLLHFLLSLHDMKWGCLSVGTFIQPTIGDVVDRLWNVTPGRLVFPCLLESKRDVELFMSAWQYDDTSASLPVSLTLLCKSKSENDEFLSFNSTTHSLANVAIDNFHEQMTYKGNKEKYKYLRKCKIFLSPGASVCTSPGLLTLATYYYQTGNYTKTLDICRHMTTSFKICFPFTDKERKTYETLFCCRGYTMFEKYKEAFASPILLTHNYFYPSEMYQITRIIRGIPIFISSLSYSVFLSFLCYNDLGDTRRRDAAVADLQVVKYDESKRDLDSFYSTWMVHNMLGLCYEIVGDTQRALREYRHSIAKRNFRQYQNNAKERIDRLQSSLKEH